MLIEHLKWQSEATGAPRIGAWNIGSCPRLLWYTLHLPEVLDRRISRERYLIFRTGDEIELRVKLMLGTLRGTVCNVEPQTMDLLITDETSIRVRADLLYNGTPVEVKGMSNPTFYRFRDRNDIGFRYRVQVECYMRAYESEQAIFIGVRRETGELHEAVFERDDYVWAQAQHHLRLAIAEDAPMRPYELDRACPGMADGRCINGLTPKARRVHMECQGTGLNLAGPALPYPCSYCAAKAPCWGELMPC